MGGLPQELGPCDSALVVGRRASPRDPWSQAAGRRGVPCAVHALRREPVLPLRSLLPKSGPLCLPPTPVRGRGSMPLGNICLEKKRGQPQRAVCEPLWVTPRVNPTHVLWSEADGIGGHSTHTRHLARLHPVNIWLPFFSYILKFRK